MIVLNVILKIFSDIKMRAIFKMVFSSPPGPATVRMVTTTGSAPLALPVQVPPGHVVQQILDESGTLQHVILSQPLCYHVSCAHTIHISINEYLHSK